MPQQGRLHEQGCSISRTSPNLVRLLQTLLTQRLFLSLNGFLDDGIALVRLFRECADSGQVQKLVDDFALVRSLERLVVSLFGLFQLINLCCERLLSQGKKFSPVCRLFPCLCIV